MEIILAKSVGFCLGVKKAVECVYKEAQFGIIYTYGSVIHNKTVISDLEKMGVRVTDNLDDISEGNRVVIRSHGVGPDVYRRLDKAGAVIIDCTCPHVRKIHDIVKNNLEKGKKVIIAGDKQHPEVIGINGWAGDSALIFCSAVDANKHDFENREYALVTQSTFKTSDFNEIVSVLNMKGVRFDSYNTICLATLARQAEAYDLSKLVDKMIVFGDKGSSNSAKLAEICAKNCKSVYFVESIRDLELNIFSSNDKIGITAGASTPPATIKEALQLMNDFKKNQTNGINENNEVKVNNDDKDNSNNKDQSFEEMLDKTFVTLHTGDVVKGTVISVSNGEVSVNLGFKSDGLIQKGEFSDDPDENPADLVKRGDEVEVFVIRVNDGEGNVLLSKKRVDSQKGMEDIEKAVESGAILKGKVIDVVKGGLIAIIKGIRAFVPSSQISDRFVEDMSIFKGKEFDFNILEFDKQKRRIIAGRKELAKKQVLEQKAKFFSSVEVGQRLEGTVNRTVNFGAFVDLGGVDGLIHISELSWGRVKKVSDVLKEGDKVLVTVLEVNKEKEKISLSLKDVEKDPWLNAAEKYAIGKIVTGRVVRIVSFGAFVELDEGVDGLIHISQISPKRIEKPEDELSVGQVINVKVTDINLETKKISLSKKAAEADLAKAAEGELVKAYEDPESVQSDVSEDAGNAVLEESVKEIEENIIPEP